MLLELVIWLMMGLDNATDKGKWLSYRRPPGKLTWAQWHKASRSKGDMWSLITFRRC